jgi:hypothetical protein
VALLSVWRCSRLCGPLVARRAAITAGAAVRMTERWGRSASELRFHRNASSRPSRRCITRADDAQRSQRTRWAASRSGGRISVCRWYRSAAHRHARGVGPALGEASLGVLPWVRRVWVVVQVLPWVR